MEGQNSALGLIASLSRKQKILFFGAILVFVAVIIIVSILLSRPRYGAEREMNAAHIDITNFSELAQDTPKFYKLETEANIWTTLHDYNDVADDVFTEAVIRTESFTDENRWVSFLLDIPSLKQSFRVEFSWVKTNGIPEEFDISISCPKINERIYDTSCYTSEYAIDTIDTFLPETLADESGVEVSLSWDGSSGGLYVNADYIKCEESFDEKSIKKVVDDWIDKLGFDTAEIEVRYNSWCPIKSAPTEIEYEEDGDHRLPEETLRAMDE